MNKDQRTEKPTDQRLKKAREEGRVPASREFPFALQWLIFAILASSFAPRWIQDLGVWSARLWMHCGTADLSTSSLRLVTTVPIIWPLLAAGGLVWLTGFGGHCLTTGFNFAPSRLAPDFNRLNPSSKLADLPSQNFANFMQTLVLFPLLTLMLALVISGQVNNLLPLSRLPVASAMSVWGAAIEDVIWKAAWAFLAYGAWDLFRQHKRWMDGLKMSKQEVRDEWKQQEGNPEIKMRIRRIRRDLLRRRMMSEVPKATAVIVNPTHYAVALRYQHGQMGVPKVVAKGKNYLALRIRDLAVRNQVPIIENPPLAQALYKSVEVGQEIPAHLYRAVAEILAYLYRVLNGRLPG